MSRPFDKILLLAGRHMSSGRLREAAAVYRQVLHRDPHHPAALHGLGVLAFRAGRIDAAEKLLLRALAADPNLASAHDDLGSIRLLRGDVEDAIEQYRMAIESDAAFGPAHVHLGDALTQLGQLEQAVAAYQRVARLSMTDWRRRSPGIDLPADATGGTIQPPIFAAPPNGEPAPPAVLPPAPQLESSTTQDPVPLAESAQPVLSRGEHSVSEPVPLLQNAIVTSASMPTNTAPVLTTMPTGIAAGIELQPGPAVSVAATNFAANITTTAPSRWPATAAVDALPVPAPQAPTFPQTEAEPAFMTASIAATAAPMAPAAEAHSEMFESVWGEEPSPGEPEVETSADLLMADEYEPVLIAEAPQPMVPMIEPEIGDPRLDAPWAAARRRIAAVRTAPPAATPRKPAPVQPGLAIRPITPPVIPPPPQQPVAPVFVAERMVETTLAEASPPGEAPPPTTTTTAPPPGEEKPPEKAEDVRTGISTVSLGRGPASDEDPLVATRLLAKQLRRARRAPRDVAVQAQELYKQSSEHIKEKRVEDAIDVLQQLVQLHPGSAKAHRDLGAAYLRVDRLDEAHAALVKALELRPRFGDAYASLGDVYHLQGKVDEAIACYRRALSLKPGAAKIHSNLLLTLNYHRKLDPKSIFEEHLRWAQQHAVPLEATLRPHDNPVNPDRQLRIGYVSPDFRRHSVNFFAEPLFAHHDRTAFNLTCYSDVAKPDAHTQRITEMCDQWRDIRDMSDDEVAAQVRDDRIDILIDLAGHTGGNRLGVFARKPAPVQVTYLGYPNTTGMRVMDFRITDAAADPPGAADQLHSEQLVRLPNFLCYNPPADAPEPSPPPIVKNGYVTFGCFNILAKVTPEAMSLWAKLMLVLPNSRLVMKDRIGSFASAARRRYVQDIFAYHRISPDRIELLEKERDFASHLKTYERVDVMLDPFPYNGTTTTCEALWMGVPVITLAGNRHAARVGVSVMTAAGFPEFIATTPENYARTAVILARDPARLQILRQTLRAKLRSSALLDGKRITAALEHRFRMMWHRWCKLRQEAMQPAAESMSLSDE